jgi:hypothetical protein
MYKYFLGYDRFDFYLDNADVKALRSALEPYCHNLTFDLRNMRYNPLYKAKCIALQPVSKFFVELGRYTLKNAITFQPSRIECACDVIAETSAEALALRGHFLQSVCMPRQRNPVQRRDGDHAIYFRPLCDAGEDVRGRNLVIYSDKPSKMRGTSRQAFGRPCAHFELRAQGSEATAAWGIVTPEDAATFDHRALWRSALRYYRMPHKTELGRRLAGAARASQISATALLARANRFLGQYQEDGQFVLQNAVLEYRDLVEQLERIDFDTWISEVCQ